MKFVLVLIFENKPNKTSKWLFVLELSPQTQLKTKWEILWGVKEASTLVLKLLFFKLEILYIFSQGTSNLQRAALGDIKNVASSRHNSVSTDEPSKDFKQPLKPLATRRFDLL